MISILRPTPNSPFAGCDFVVQLDRQRENTPIRLLQLTDTQIIDASQTPRSDWLRADEVRAWDPANFDLQCGDHIRSLVAQADPDLIFLTGDLVYGSFDHNGSVLTWFCQLMDSFKIPWAPVFGNHDNESKRGVAWQCAQFENSEYCIFSRGEVTGNGNYTVGIAVGEQLVRVLYMLDTNGCRATEDPEVVKKTGVYPDQLELVTICSQKLAETWGKPIPGFMAFHIPMKEFAEAAAAKGYPPYGESYTIGVDVPALDGDFGCAEGPFRPFDTGIDFVEYLHKNHIDGVFTGHWHSINTCITWQNIRWVFGLKTGQYDFHNPYQLGGTLVTLLGENFFVNHIPTLSKCGGFPAKAPIFSDFFVS